MSGPREPLTTDDWAVIADRAVVLVCVVTIVLYAIGGIA